MATDTPLGAGGRALVTLAGLALIAFASVAVNWTVRSFGSGLVAGLVVLPILAVGAWKLLKAAGRVDGDPTLVRLLVIALLLKLVAALVYYLVFQHAYQGSADAFGYIQQGKVLATQMRHGIFDTSQKNLGGFTFWGTGFMYFVVGALFVVLGPSRLVAFFVFTLFAFFGQYLFYRAFRIALPEGDRRRYRLLLFFMPGLVFWTAAVGKDAWMMLFLGVCAYGGARVLTGMRFGYTLLAIGVPALGIVRPHVAAFVIAGMGIAYIKRKVAKDPSLFRPLAWVVGAIVLVVASVVMLTMLQRFFHVDQADSNAAGNVLQQTAERTSDYEGSEFEPPRVHSLADLPLGIVTVVARPFPFEARNGPMFISSLEGTALLGLMLLSIRRWWRLPRIMFAEPYVRYAATFSVLFIVAFSYIGNFGLLARQRVQMLPFLFVLLALPTARNLRAAPPTRPGARQR